MYDIVRTWVERRLEDGDSVVLQHVQQLAKSLSECFRAALVDPSIPSSFRHSVRGSAITPEVTAEEEHKRRDPGTAAWRAC